LAEWSKSHAINELAGVFDLLLVTVNVPLDCGAQFGG
jgi:hypothetical protein